MESKVKDTEETGILAKSTKNYYSTDVVKKTTNFSNQQIIDLCKNGIVQPKKTLDGKIYFTKDDFSVMQKLSKAHEELGFFEKRNKIDKDEKNKQENIKTAKFELNQKIKLPKLSSSALDKENNIEAKQTLSNENYNIKEFEINLMNKIESLLSKKLDGLDEVVVELIRAKTEINVLRSKLDEMEAKNYNLSNIVNSYKNIGFGLYIKSKEEIKG